MSLLITKLRTKEDMDLLQGELELLKSSLYQKDKNYSSVQENPAFQGGDELNSDMSSSLGEPRLLRRGGRHKEVLENDIRSWVSEIISTESKEVGIEKFLESTEAELKTVSILSAVIAFEPSDSFVDRFSTFVKTNVSPNAVIDFLFNRELLGGIQLSYRGKYIDLSLRGKISKEFDDPELLKKLSPSANMTKTGKN